MVEVGEFQEALEFFDVCGLWPGLNGQHLPLVNPNATTVNMITQELYGWLMKLAFLSFEEEVELPDVEGPPQPGGDVRPVSKSR